MKIFKTTSFLLVSILCFSLFSCKDDDDAQPQVQVVKYVPTMAEIDQQVKIVGKNFSAKTLDNQVSFNGVKAEVLAASDTVLVVKVPQQATTGPVAVTLRGKTIQGPSFTVLKDNVELQKFGDGGEGLAQNGNTTIFDGRLRLTSNRVNQTGCVYYGAKLLVKDGFETTFDFQISFPGGLVDPEGKIGADGFAFVIQNQGPNAIGNQGGSIGYSNITNCLAIEFDTFANTPGSEYSNGEPDGNHISIQTNGAGPNNPAHRFSIGHTSAIPELADGKTHRAKIKYDGNTMRVYLDDMNTPVLETQVNLSSRLNLDNGKAYVGFTSSTGQGYEAHDIMNWKFESVK